MGELFYKHRTGNKIRKQLKRVDVHGSVHHNINLIEITNKMRPRSRIYYSSVS